jgi:DNA-binding CsgD family transcriptional regulator
MAVSPIESAPPLIGRDAELDRIAGLRASGSCPGVVIQAPAGVGKSRLAREAVAAAERDGALTGWVQATRSAAAVPLAAFVALLPPDARSDDLLALMRQSMASLRSRADGRPIVLGVDDAQCLDPTSAALTLQLAATGTAFLIVTLRLGEPAPDAVVSLWKDTGVARLELAPLDEAGTTELLEAALGGPIEQRAARWFYETSQGNALYASELLAGGVASASLAQVGSLWRMRGRPPVSESLGDLVATRLATLGEEERDAVELLAFGEPLPLALATELTGNASLVAAEKHRMIVLEGSANDSAVRLAHPLYGEVVRSSVPTSVARELRLRLAALVQERTPLPADDALRVARWLLDAGEPIPLPLLTDAAGAAIGAADGELCAQLASLALDAGGGVPAALLLARAHIAENRFEEAAIVLEGTQDAVGDADVALDYLELYIWVLFWGLGREDDLRHLLERAQAWWPDALWQQRLQPLRLYVAGLGKPYGATVEMSQEILADGDLDDEVRRRVEPIHASDLFYAGRARDAVALADRIRPPVPLRRPNDDLAFATWTMIAIETGEDWHALEHEATALVREAVRADDHVATGFAALALACLRAAAGRLDDASRWLAEAELRMERHDTFGFLSVVCECQVEIAATRGDADAAGAALARCRDSLDGKDPRPGQQQSIIRAQAWAQYALGDPLEAQRLLLRAAADIEPMPLLAAQLAYDAMRLGARPSAVAPLLANSAARCDARMTAACAAHAQARAERDGAAVLAASEELEAIGAVVYALEAAAEAAALFADEGREDSARRAAARARDLHATGSGLRPLEIPGIDDADVALTNRERQLVDLAKQGLSNAEIADRLVLSVRTVESHIYRAMQKLGVGDRRML